MLTTVIYLVLQLPTGAVAIPQQDMAHCKSQAAAYMKANTPMYKPMCISGVISK